MLTYLYFVVKIIITKRKQKIMYMNRTKRNLIIAAAIVNLIGIISNLVLSILLIVNTEGMADYKEYFYFVGYSTTLAYTIISFLAGLLGSLFLLWSVRSKGKYFRTTQGLYISGFVIVVICGSFVPWILLFISLFIPDIIVMNTKSEVKREERVEEMKKKAEEQFYEEKKKKIEDLKRLRENGLISEEEYKQKLFELL